MSGVLRSSRALLVGRQNGVPLGKTVWQLLEMLNTVTESLQVTFRSLKED